MEMSSILMLAAAVDQLTNLLELNECGYLQNNPIELSEPAVLYISLSSKFSARNKTNRALIRQHIVDQYGKQLSTQEAIDVLNLLKSPPNLNSLFISISHCLSLGGYIVSNHPVGLDLEDYDRLTKDIVARVSNPGDIQRAPHFSFLWVAKEACYKLFSAESKDSTLGLALSDIGNFIWKPHKLGYTFEANIATKMICGIVVKKEKTLVSIAFFS